MALLLLDTVSSNIFLLFANTINVYIEKLFAKLLYAIEFFTVVFTLNIVKYFLKYLV